MKVRHDAIRVLFLRDINYNDDASKKFGNLVNDIDQPRADINVYH